MKSKLISLGATSLLLPAGGRISSLGGLLLAAGAGAAAVLEVFDGAIGVIATETVSAGGTGYEVGDTLTLELDGTDGEAAEYTVATVDGLVGEILTASLNAAGTGYTALDVLTVEQVGGGVQATIRVDTVGGSGEILTFTLLTGGSGYIVDTGLTVTGGTGNDDATFDADTVAVGEIATVTLVSGGAGYLAGETYTTTSDGAGTGAEIDADTVSDTGVSIAKLGALQGTSDSVHLKCVTVDNGLSARLSGTGAQAYVFHE